MQIKKPFNRPDWNTIPQEEVALVEASFDAAADAILSRSGFRYALKSDHDYFLIGPHGAQEWQFRITKVDDGEFIFDEARPNGRPIYVGPLDEEFGRRLHDELVARLPDEARIAFRDAIPGMPRDEAASLASLEAMFSPRAVAPLTPRPQTAAPASAGDHLLTYRKKTGVARPDWA